MSVANAKHTVLNPVIPYTGPIPGGLHPGEIIIIQGTVAPDADRFQIDLSSGCSTKPRSDVALHFSPRFKGSPCVVCNSLLQESWGKEETLHQLPYKRGAPFETIILVHEDIFKVAVNGAHLLEYKHRIPLNTVNMFSISGKVRVHAIGYIPNSVIIFTDISEPPLQRQYTQRTEPRAAHHNQRTGQHVSSQFHCQPPQQRDREHRSSSEPPHEVRCVHQELIPG
ncbi:unnamed protein product [Scomber scombrus]|uniref:Galectin n=1 Tax=Scomber scombrus TaxID=13677 RepID=A0AAV1PUR9_SCOSC